MEKLRRIEMKPLKIDGATWDPQGHRNEEENEYLSHYGSAHCNVTPALHTFGRQMSRGFQDRHAPK